MNISFNRFMPISSNTFFSFKENFISSLTPLQKKISFVAAAALSLMVIYYAVKHCAYKFYYKINIEKTRANEDLKHEYQNQVTLGLTKGTHAGPLSLDEKIEMAKKAGIFLKNLSFLYSDITEQQLQEVLKACPNIEKLDLSECVNLTGDFIKKLPQGLVSLNLGAMHALTDEALQSGLPKKLKTLHLPDCRNVTSAVIKHLPRDLEELNLTYSLKMTEVGLQDWPSKLQVLDLTECSNFTNASLKQLPKDLKSLTLSNCSHFTDDFIPELPQTLQTLFLDGCKQISNKGVQEIPRGIKTLSLRACGQLADEALKGLPNGLTSLHLPFCRFTDAILKDLPVGLQELDLSGCNQITDNFLLDLQYFPKLVKNGLKQLNLEYCHVKRGNIKIFKDSSLKIID